MLESMPPDHRRGTEIIQAYDTEFFTARKAVLRSLQIEPLMLDGKELSQSLSMDNVLKFTEEILCDVELQPIPQINQLRDTIPGHPLPAHHPSNAVWTIKLNKNPAEISTDFRPGTTSGRKLRK